MPSIKTISAVLPKHKYNNSDILTGARTWLQGDPTAYALFERFVKAANTQDRYYVQSIEEILELGGMANRSELFEKEGTILGNKSIKSVLEHTGLDPEKLSTFIFTSCTCPAIPSIDANLIQENRLPATISRIPLFQHGCAGGVIGLQLANKFAQNGNSVLLTSVELCSLGFQLKNITPGQLVGSAIFGDGACSVIVSPENRGLVFVSSRSVLTRNSRHLMGYNVHDDGYHLRLDKELPSFLSHHIPSIAKDFLDENGLKHTDIKYWLFHPGGAKILSCLEEAFSLEAHQAYWARKVLKEVGNLSSASILFVADEFLKSNPCKEHELVLLLGVGPGLTVEMILFEWRD